MAYGELGTQTPKPGRGLGYDRQAGSVWSAQVTNGVNLSVECPSQSGILIFFRSEFQKKVQ